MYKRASVLILTVALAAAATGQPKREGQHRIMATASSDSAERCKEIAKGVDDLFKWWEAQKHPDIGRWRLTMRCGAAEQVKVGIASLDKRAYRKYEHRGNHKDKTQQALVVEIYNMTKRQMLIGAGYNPDKFVAKYTEPKH